MEAAVLGRREWCGGPATRCWRPAGWRGSCGATASRRTRTCTAGPWRTRTGFGPRPWRRWTCGGTGRTSGVYDDRRGVEWTEWFCGGRTQLGAQRPGQVPRHARGVPRGPAVGGGGRVPEGAHVRGAGRGDLPGRGRPAAARGGPGRPGGPVPPDGAGGGGGPAGVREGGGHRDPGVLRVRPRRRSPPGCGDCEAKLLITADGFLPARADGPPVAVRGRGRPAVPQRGAPPGGATGRPHGRVAAGAGRVVARGHRGPARGHAHGAHGVHGPLHDHLHVRDHGQAEGGRSTCTRGSPSRAAATWLSTSTYRPGTWSSGSRTWAG
jgi:hypothetical protein